MDGPGEHYAKWNKPVREGQIPYDLIYIWGLMYKINYQSGDRFMDTENRLTAVRGESEGVKEKRKTHGQTRVWWLPERKGSKGEVEEGKEGINGDGRRLDGW